MRVGDVDALVKTGLDDGGLLPAQETRARVLGKKDIAALRAYIDTTTPITALSGSHTRGKPPVATESGRCPRREPFAT